MEEEIKISVVVPTYNRPDLLETCMEKLLLQSFNKNAYEIIVVNDGGATKSEFVVNKKEKGNPHISYFLLPSNKGPAAARNFGWKKAKGQLITFTDDDCRPDKNWLQALWNAYQGEKEIAFTGKMIVPVSKNPTDSERNLAHLESADFVTANCACTRNALEKVNGFDERFSKAWREDSDLEFKLLQNNVPIIQINSAVVVHPVREPHWGSSLKDQEKSRFNALLYKKFPDLYRKKIQSGPPLLYYMMIAFFLIFLIGVVFQSWWISISAFFLWFFLGLRFAFHRLSGTSHDFSHITEMLFTSFLIPFLSVYWRIYGAYKYKTVFF